MKKLVWLAFEYRDVGFQEQRIQCLEAPFVEQKALKSKDKNEAALYNGLLNKSYHY